MTVLRERLYNPVMPTPAPRSRGARERAAKRWYVYLILCRSNAIYTGIALDVAEAAIKRLPAAEKRKLVGTTGATTRKLLLD